MGKRQSGGFGVKTSRKVLIGGTAIVLVIVVILAIITVKMANEYKRFTPLETSQLNSDLYVIKDGFVNLFILRKDGQYMVIDTGYKRKNVENGFRQFGIDLSGVSSVLLTHTDYDHVAQLGLYKNAKVYISADEEKMINGELNKSPFMRNKLTSDYILLQNNGIHEIAVWNVRTILLPGHTSGSVCYVVDDKYLFTGDSIALINGQVEPFNDFFNMDTERQIQNIVNIAHLENIELVLTGHYGSSTRYPEIFDTWNSRRRESN